MKPLIPEVIRAITPMFIATIGAVIAVAVIVSPNSKNNPAQLSSGFGLAGTAIAVPAGLAQSSKSESDFSVSKEGDKLNVSSPSSEPADG